MHADEVATDAALVKRLLASQFPQWASWPIEAVLSSGTDHALYRLGDEMIVRLPRIAQVVGQGDKEQEWLPMLAPHLPLRIPVPLAQGAPGEGYPWKWSIYRWLEGDRATLDRVVDAHQFATDLARFIISLQRIESTGGPLAGEHNFFRGVPLVVRDAPTRAALGALRGMIDVEAATLAWENALRVPISDEAPVWIHGDLQAGNLLAVQGRLSAVIDFGSLGVGDPAVDLIVAWNLLPFEARETFRAALAVDEATWARGRGWALSIALIQLPYYHQTNPTLAANARYAIAEVLADGRH